jgi:hypothetical protein
LANDARASESKTERIDYPVQPDAQKRASNHARSSNRLSQRWTTGVEVRTSCLRAPSSNTFAAVNRFPGNGARDAQARIDFDGPEHADLELHLCAVRAATAQPSYVTSPRRDRRHRRR